MVLIPEFTEEFRLDQVRRGRQSLFYFTTAILGLNLADKQGKSQLIADHGDLCSFLEGRRPHHPWNMAMVAAFRGFGKSVITTQAYPLWRGVYCDGHSAKIISNSYQNAKVNHFQKMLNLWISSSRSDYLQWLYQERLPTGFEGWNQEQIAFLSSNPQSAPSITYWGIESKFEGWHGDLIILDDPEGADADTSKVANQFAWDKYQSVIPLLAEPARGQVLIVLTPHGSRPMAWRIRDQEKGWQSEADNGRHRTGFRIFWRALLNEQGKSRWPQRFPDDYVQGFLSKTDIFAQQYMLWRRVGRQTLFDMDQVSKSFYEFTAPGPAQDQKMKLIRYPAYKFDPDKLSEQGHVLPEPEIVHVSLRSLRYYLHFDPIHKEESARRSAMSRQRPAYPAISVIGVAPDSHCFLVDYWIGNEGKDEDLGKQAMKLFHFYRMWTPYRVTWESIGAQHWLKSFIESMERQSLDWGRPRSTGMLSPPRYLARLSSVLVASADEKQSKEQVYRETLSPWVNLGILHFRKDQVQPLRQLEYALDESEAVDLLDSLAQGPAVWKPPITEEMERGISGREKFVRAMVTKVGGWMSRTGYTPRGGG